jgi:hypothetical protein
MRRALLLGLDDLPPGFTAARVSARALAQQPTQGIDQAGLFIGGVA